MKHIPVHIVLVSKMHQPRLDLFTLPFSQTCSNTFYTENTYTISVSKLQERNADSQFCMGTIRVLPVQVGVSIIYDPTIPGNSP